MRGHVHIILRRAANHYRLMFVPGGPDRHFIEGEEALRTFLLTELEIPPGLTETATTELGNSGRYTIENILVTDKITHFWRLDTTPKPTSPEPPKPAKRKPSRPVSRRTLAKPKSTRKVETEETTELSRRSPLWQTRSRASRPLLYRPEEPNCLPKPSCSVSKAQRLGDNDSLLGKTSRPGGILLFR